MVNMAKYYVRDKEIRSFSIDRGLSDICTELRINMSAAAQDGLILAIERRKAQLAIVKEERKG